MTCTSAAIEVNAVAVMLGRHRLLTATGFELPRGLVVPRPARRASYRFPAPCAGPPPINWPCRCWPRSRSRAASSIGESRSLQTVSALPRLVWVILSRGNHCAVRVMQGAATRAPALRPPGRRRRPPRAPEHATPCRLAADGRVREPLGRRSGARRARHRERATHAGRALTRSPGACRSGNRHRGTLPDDAAIGGQPRRRCML